MTQADQNHDPLFDPRLSPDPALARMQQLLATQRIAVPIQLPEAVRQATLTQPIALRRRRLVKRFAQAAVLMLLIGSAVMAYRLHWRSGAAWAIDDSAGARWQVGASLHDPRALSVRVARIGQLALAPNARARLLESATGTHRIALQSGRLHARIWAPPAWFAVQVGKAQIVDLGCEFILDVGVQRSELQVLSGWVAYQADGQELLVPAGYSLSFDSTSAALPVRTDASPEFAQALLRLHALAQSSDVANPELSASIGALTQNARALDAYSLLSVLTRYPKLAQSELYPKLTSLLELPNDSAHRQAWVRGDLAAIEVAWQRLPMQPKQWWKSWADAL